jgi:uncharacterized protein YndB with AHSA1/START domain
MDTATQDLTLEVRRTFPTTPARVYAAWTQAEALTRWFAPSAEMTTIVHELDVRVGGRYRIEMRSPDGKQHIACGTYTELASPHRLAFTWAWESNVAEQTLVTIDIAPRGASATELVLRHTRFATEASRDGHNKGWQGCLNRMEASF